MKKFIKSFILVVCLVFPSLFCLTACDNAEHEHEFATEWSSDAGYHFHKCTVEGCEETIDKTVHIFGDITIDRTPTTKNSGLYHHECTICHRVEEKIVSALISTGFEFELNEDETSYTLTGIGTCTDTFINVPNTFNGLPVTAIKNEAFNNTNITGIVLSNNTIRIGDYAFANCSQLESVTLQKGVTTIGMYAFYKCSSLTNVTLPATITSIGVNCFQHSGLTSVEIPANITTIGGYTFDSCENLTNIVVPNGVTTIGGNAFSGSINLETLVIPKSVKNIDMYIVYNCPKLSKIFYTGTQAEWNTINNQGKIDSTKLYFYSETIPQKLNTNFWHYVDGIPESWPEHAEHTYGEWEKDETNHWKTCSYCGFKNINTHTFSESYSYNETNHWHECVCGAHDEDVSHPFKNGICGDCDFARIELAFNYVETSNSYEVSGIGRITSSEIVIPSTYDDGTHGTLAVTSIKDSAFKDKTTITSITIPNSVTKIDINAFYGCTGLNGSVVIPDSVTSMGGHAFYKCSNLKSVIIGSGLEYISYSTFTQCSSLTTVSLGNNIKRINTFAFQECSSLTSILFPDGLTKISENAFYMCGLTSIVIPNSVTELGDNAFSSCSNLTSVVIGSGITNISGTYFDKCSSIAKVYYYGNKEALTINEQSVIYGATKYYYSETQPTTAGNYWRYVDGVPTEWINITLKVNAKTGDDALTYGDTISYTASDVVATGLDSGESIESLGTLSFVYSTEENGTYTSTLPKNVGTYYVKVAGCISNKYNITYTAGELEIKKARLTITVLDRTSDNALTYGDDAEYSTDFITVEGLKYDDTIANAGDFKFEYKSSLSSDYGSGVPKNAGTYSVRADITNSANYTSTCVEGTLEIKKATLTVTIPNIECTYGTIKGCETTITGFKYGEYRESDPEDTNPNRIIIEENAKLYNPVTGAEIPTNGPSTYIDVGTYQYRPYYTAKNYDFEYVPGATYTIKPKEIKIKAKVVFEVHCGDEIDGLNVEYLYIDDHYPDNNIYWIDSPYGQPDNRAMITGTLSYTTNYTKDSPAGNYTIKAQGLTCGSSNYTIIWLETTFEVLV